MPRKKSTKIEPTEIKPTDIQPTKIEPTEIKPAEIEPTEIKPTEIKPTEIKPTEIKPTDIQPTEIKPTEIEPFETPKVEPANVNKPLKNVQTAVYNKANAVTYFVLSIIASAVLLWIGLAFGLTVYLLPVIFSTVFAYFMFITEIKKLQITQADLDAWKQQILAKHPNFNKQQLDTMTLDLYNKSLLNKFSYWTHTFKVSFNKVLACILLPVAVMSAGAGVVLPVLGVGGGSGDVVGTYVSESINNSSIVIVTAYKFNSDKTYKRGYYDKEDNKYTWESQTYNYSISGSKVTVSGGYFTIKNGGKKLLGSDGSYFIRR